MKLSLISVGIRVFNAVTPAGEITFRQVHKTCGTPIQLKKWCPSHDREVSNDELAKGYEIEKGEFVLLDPADIKAVRPPATYTVEISRVVDQSEIDPAYVERPYYVLPDNKMAGSALAVIRQALSKKAAIGTVALHGREYVVALVPRGAGLLMLTLRRAGEVVPMSGIDAEELGQARVNATELKLAHRVLDGFAGHLDLKKYPDQYEAALRKIIEDKAEGRKIVTAAVPKAGKVMNLMDALRQSLAQAGGARGARERAAQQRGRPVAPAARRMRPARGVPHPAAHRSSRRHRGSRRASA